MPSDLAGTPERVIYSYKPSIMSWNLGNVHVTTSTVELGGMRWNTVDIRDVRFATIEIVSSRGSMDSSPYYTPLGKSPILFMGIVAVILSGLLFWVDTAGVFSGAFVRILIVALFISGVSAVLYSIYKNPPKWKVLTIELLLPDGNWHKATGVRWSYDDRWAADRTIESIRQVAHPGNTESQDAKAEAK